MFLDLRKKNAKTANQNQSNKPFSSQISSKIVENSSAIKQRINVGFDLIFYEFETNNQEKFLIIYFDDMINKEILDRDIIGPIIENDNKDKDDKFTSMDQIKSIIHFTNATESTEYDGIIKKLLSGDAIMFIEGIKSALCLPSQGWTQRSITEPDAEIITKGPREGFVETLKTNRSLIRRKVQSPNLVFEKMTMGKQTNSTVNLVYLDNIVNEKILANLKKRLSKINIDAIIDTGYIEEIIRDERMSPFNTIGYTERPDVVAAKILEGRIGIMLDGSPIVLTVPFLFIENIQANEDYYNGFIIATLNRLLRYASFLLTIFVPGLYVAIATNHHELIPSKLLFSFIASRVGVPFPTIIEVLAMILLFELLRESGLRLPKGLGQTVSIVGALVLGQAAVEAKFISAPVVIVIALTAITSFIFYDINAALTTCRFAVTIMGAMFGLYGVVLGLIAIFLHLYSLQSFGVPYMSYINSTKGQEVKDTLIRAPWWYANLRPKLLSTKNRVRQGRGDQ